MWLTLSDLWVQSARSVTQHVTTEFILIDISCYFIIFNKLKMIVKISESVLWSILSGVILSLNKFYYKYLLGSKHEYSSREAELRNMCWLYKQYVLRKSFRMKLMDEALAFN